MVPCSSYSELIHYNITLTSNNVSSQVLTTSGGVCTTVCSATLSLSGPGNYQLELHATNEKGVSDSVTWNITCNEGFRIVEPASANCTHDSLWQPTLQNTSRCANSTEAPELTSIVIN